MSFSHPLQLSRRTLLRQLGATGVLVTLGPAGAWATQAMVQQAVRDRIGTREPQAHGVTLRLPKIAETGNSVPLTVTVESPMIPDDHVLHLHVFVEGNPAPVAATYHFGVRAGKAEMSTRIRLARSQTVLALAIAGAGEPWRYSIAERRSGYTYLSEDNQRLQDDDFANPGLLWVERGRELWQQIDSTAGTTCPGVAVACPSKRLLCGAERASLRYQDSDNFSTTSFRASTREQSSHRCLSGSIVSL